MLKRGFGTQDVWRLSGYAETLPDERELPLLRIKIERSVISGLEHFLCLHCTYKVTVGGSHCKPIYIVNQAVAHNIKMHRGLCTIEDYRYVKPVCRSVPEDTAETEGQTYREIQGQTRLFEGKDATSQVSPLWAYPEG